MPPRKPTRSTFEPPTADLSSAAMPRLSADTRSALRRIARALGRLAAREYLASKTEPTTETDRTPPVTRDPAEDRQ